MRSCTKQIGVYLNFLKTITSKIDGLILWRANLDEELRITANTRLCSDHFTRDRFINFRLRQLGFTDNPLLLVNGAEPTISRLSLHPPVLKAVSANMTVASFPASGRGFSAASGHAPSV